MHALHPQTFKFLTGIKKNNNKPWFEKNKKLYEEIKNDAINFAADLIGEIGKFDAAVKGADPKKSVMRIYRDVRFSKNKAPYKSNVGIGISSGEKTFVRAGYYVHVAPGENFLGGGIWMPETETLSKIRQEIDYNFSNFKKIVESPSFKKTFGALDSEMKLSRPPKNYDENNPAIEYLKLKSFVAGAKFSDAQILSTNFVKDAAKVFKQMHPFIDFLNQAMS